MAFQYMTGQELLAITRPWVDNNHAAHAVLMSRPLTAAMMPDMTAAHEALETELHPHLALLINDLIQRTVAVDKRHDDLVRVIDARLAVEITLTTDPATSERLTLLRTLLIPDGLAIVKKSYAHEVGQAEMVAARVTSADRELLRAIPMMTGTLEDIVDNYFATARQLGDLEQQRRQLGDSRSGRGGLMTARHRWARVVNLIVQGAEVLGTEDTEVQALVKAVDQAKYQAVVRRRERLASGEDEDSGEESGEGEDSGETSGEAVEDRDTSFSNVSMSGPGPDTDPPAPDQNPDASAPVEFGQPPPGQPPPGPALTADRLAL